jgi:hypothetical protein
MIIVILHGQNSKIQIASYLAFSDLRFSPPVTEPGTIQING